MGADRAVLGQRLQGCEAAAAGDHGIGAVGIVSLAAGYQVLQQAVGSDGRLDLGIGAGVGRGLADVLGREREAGERDLPDQRLGPGGDVVHADLRQRMEWMGRAPEWRLSPAVPRPPGHSPALRSARCADGDR